MDATIPPDDLAALAERILDADRRYYRQADPDLSDAEYDDLRRRYLAACAAAGVEPDGRVVDRPGDDRTDGFAKVRHRVPMLSLDKCASDGESTADDQLIAWWHGTATRKDLRERHDLPAEADLSLCVEPKIDGMSVSLAYQDGRLVRAATRGDGLEGDDITANVLAAACVPARLRRPVTCEVRGELYLPRSAFARLNAALAAEGRPPLANERNAGAGLMKSKDPASVAGKGVAAFIYQVAEGDAQAPWSQIAAMDWLRGLGLPVNDAAVKVPDGRAAVAVCQAFAGRRDQLDYATDGLVIKVDDRRLHDRLGGTEHHPHWGVAYKYPPERRPTRLLDILIQVGKSGKLTPVAVLAPVRLAGTTVERASLHNFAELQRKDVRVGDLVLVEKAGEIIPQVVAVVPGERAAGSVPTARPERCPVCATPAVHEEVLSFCPNPGCPAQVRERLRHFASRGAMDITDLGPAVIDQVVDLLGVRTPADLFRLDRARLLTLPRTGDKSVANLLGALEQAKGRGLARVLTGLSLEHIGEKMAEELAKRYSSAAALLELGRRHAAGDATTVAELQTISGIGERTANLILRQLSSESIRSLFADLASVGVLLDQVGVVAREISGVAGKSFVLTGTLPTLSRTEAEALIRQAGGIVSGSLSRRTSYLVVGAEAGSKLAKAQQLQIAQIDEAGLRALLAGPPAHAGPGA